MLDASGTTVFLLFHKAQLDEVQHSYGYTCAILQFQQTLCEIIVSLGSAWIQPSSLSLHPMRSTSLEVLIVFDI